MERDLIAEIGIEGDRLYVKPEKKRFPYIYREAVGVVWDEKANSLTMQKNADWNWGFVECFKEILGAAKLQSCVLSLSSGTIWNNIPDDLQNKLIEISKQFVA